MTKKSILIIFLGLQALFSSAQQELKTGAKAPQITFQKTYTKGYQIPKGKFIILDFWATWCGPCIAGLLETNEIIDKYKDQFEFIAITDTTSVNVEKFIKSQNLKHKFLLDDGKTFENFGITGIPHAYIIDRSGVIKWSGHGREITSALLDQFLTTGIAKLESKKVAETKQPAKKLLTVPNMGDFNIRISEEKLAIKYSFSINFKLDTSKYKAQLTAIPNIISSLYNYKDNRILYHSNKDLAGKKIAVEAQILNTHPDLAKFQLLEIIGYRYGFKPTIKTIDTVVYVAKVVDSKKLRPTIMTAKKGSNQAGKYSNSIQIDPFLTAMNATLPEIAANFERQFNVFCRTESASSEGFDFLNINAPNFEEFKRNLLAKYGVDLVKTREKLAFLVIE